MTKHSKLIGAIKLDGDAEEGDVIVALRQMPGVETADGYSYAHPIFRSQLDDLLVTAFDSAHGACNDWVDYVEQGFNAESLIDNIVAGRKVIVVPLGDGPQTLTMEKLLTGLQMALEKSGDTPASFFEQHDAGDADIVIQFALYGEQVFS